MNVELRFFAGIREKLGCAQESLCLPAEIETVGQVREFLCARGGIWAQTLAEGQALRMACDLVMCDAHRQIADGCEIAFFPPVTGG